MHPNDIASVKIYGPNGKLVTPADRLRLGIVKPKKQSFGLYGNIYNWQNAGRYRNRYYTLSDTSQGLDTLSRELLVRWSREMYGSLPPIKAACRILADFSIGQAYLPVYEGENKEWWKYAEEWLLEEWYPNCNVRGTHYDFRSSLRLESQLLDVDGDYLCIYGTEDGFPKFQLVQNNRIKNQDRDNRQIEDGPMKGSIISDGVYYWPNGKVVGYSIFNPGNLVNQMIDNSKVMTISARDASLVLDPEYIDKLRGVPAIGAAILQALSVQELDQYLMEKIKIESTIALIEKNQTGQAPQELQNTMQELLNVGQEAGLQGGNVPPNLHALQVVQGGEIRYVYADGGEIKTLSSNTPANESQQYMERLETQVLSTLGVPHQLVYSTDKSAGRITSSVAEIFKAAVKRRQGIYDKQGKMRVAWALSRAMQDGTIPMNDSENLALVVGFTHPQEFTLDRKYDNQIINDNYSAGLSTMGEATQKLYNKTASQTMAEQEAEQIEFYERAKSVSEKSGVPLEMVISYWRSGSKSVTTRINNDDSDKSELV